MKEIKNNRYVKKYQSEATQIPLMDSFKNIEQEAQQQLIQISDQTIPEPPLSSIGFFQEPKQINNKLRTKNKKYYNSKTTFEEIQLYLKNDFSRNVEKKRTLNKYYLSEKHLAQANKRQIFRSNSKQIKKAIPQINMSDYIDFINIQKNETLQLRRLDSKQKNFRNLSERKLSLASSNQSRNHLQSPRKSVEQKKQKLPSKISLQNKKIQKIIKQQSLVNYSNEQQSKIDSYLNNCQKLNIINMQFTVFNRSKSKKIQPKNKNI